LGLGTGVTTAVFSVLDQLVLRPLPYAEPDRLVMVWETNRARSRGHERLSPVNFGDFRALTHVFEDAAAWWYPQINLTATGTEPIRVKAVEASANFFHVVGVQPALGAGFRAEPLYDRDPGRDRQPSTLARPVRQRLVDCGLIDRAERCVTHRDRRHARGIQLPRGH
jgi:hypothetical protein